MTQQVINIGTGPSSGNGDPLRVAFTEINSNFTELYGITANLTNSVTSVAGRTGNVTLTVNDILGFRGLNLVNPAPTHSNSSGVIGQVAVDSSYMYLCTAANTWVRSSITTSF